MKPRQPRNQRSAFNVFHPFDCRCGACQARRERIEREVDEDSISARR